MPEENEFEEVTGELADELSEVVPLTVLGMDLPAASGPISHPLAAIVVVKTLEPDGSIAYRVMNTESCTGIDALGMARFADIQYEDMIRMNTSHCEHDGPCGEEEED